VIGLAAAGLAVTLAQANVSGDRVSRWLSQNPRARVLLTRERRSALPAPRLDPQTEARSILSNARRYHLTSPDAVPKRTWWQVVFQWLAERWSQLLNRLFGRAAMPARVSRPIADALLVLCILLFVVLLARIVWLFGKVSRSRIVAQPIAPPPDAAALLARSLDAAQRRDYARAVTQLFAASVALISRSGRLHGHRSDTVGEMRRRIRASDPRLDEPFAELTRSLTQAVYAELPIQSDDWSRSLLAYRRLESLLA